MISTFLPKKPKPKYFKIVPKLMSMKNNHKIGYLSFNLETHTLDDRL